MAEHDHRGPILRAVIIAADDVATAGAFLAEVCGTSAESSAQGPRVPLAEATLIVRPTIDDERGVVGVEVATDDVDHGSTRLNGIELSTVPAHRRRDGRHGERAPRSDPADVGLDHVAIVVADLDHSAASWATATGATVESIGPHPISGGAFDAARLILGDRMIELLAPSPGRPSAVAKRLERGGEGAMALALPAFDLDRKVGRLEQSGVQLVWAEPHQLIHPANPSGVLIQLTPRVQH